MVLKALRQEPVLESNKGVEESPDELVEDYIEPENWEGFNIKIDEKKKKKSSPNANK